MNGKQKIAIIGIGNVGTQVACTMVGDGLCDELVLIDCDHEKAVGQAMDMEDSLPYRAQDVRIYGGTFDDIGDADLLVFSAAGGLLLEDRLKELEVTRTIVDDVVPSILESGFHGIVLVISNPCDLIAQYMQEKSGLRVVGTGTMLDTARLRMLVARTFHVAPHSVQGYVLGEHGDSQMVPWSMCTIGGIALERWEEQMGLSLDRDELARAAKDEGWEIVKRKGCTEFGVAAACTALARSILRDEKRVLPVSVFVEEQGVYTSVPCIIGMDGAEMQLPLSLTKKEKNQLDASCHVLRINQKPTEPKKLR